jgi:hypothetical protein
MKYFICIILLVLTGCVSNSPKVIKTRLVIDETQNEFEIRAKYAIDLAVLNSKMAHNNWTFVLSQVDTKQCFVTDKFPLTHNNVQEDAVNYPNLISIYYAKQGECGFWGLSNVPQNPKEYRYGILIAIEAPYTVLSHEVGHYFGLRHTHDPIGDGIEDTPEGNDTLYPNIMSFNNDPLDNFTMGQLKYMNKVLHKSRRELLDD